MRALRKPNGEVEIAFSRIYKSGINVFIPKEVNNNEAPLNRLS